MEVLRRESVGLLEAADDQAATRTPADGGWSAAQVGYHVGFSNEAMARTATGRGRAEDAPPDFVENSAIFAAVPPKVQASAGAQPPAGTTRADALDKLDNGFKAVIEAFTHLPEERARQIVKFPFGVLSMYQFGEFVVLHARRHLEQMRRAINGSGGAGLPTSPRLRRTAEADREGG